MGLLSGLSLRKSSKIVFRNTGNRWVCYRTYVSENVRSLCSAILVKDGPVTGPESQKINEVCVLYYRPVTGPKSQKMFEVCVLYYR